MHYALQAHGAPSIHPSVMSRHRRWNALRGASGVLDSLQRETNGLAFDFTRPTPELIIRDTTTPANNFSGNFNTKVTSAYASTKRILNGAGAYEAVTVPTPEYNSSGVLLGIPFEGARTNEIRNNSMQGVVAGTPGTLPTNWGIGGSGIGTLTQTIVGAGTENGIEYVDVRFNGTTSTTDFQITLETTTQIVAATGQTWTFSLFASLAGGSISNITQIRPLAVERTSGGTLVVGTPASNIASSLTGVLQRFSPAITLAGGGTVARVQPAIQFLFSSAVAIDITLRIGWPQMEQAAFASSPIRTTSAAVTRSADNATLAVANFPSMSAGGHMVASWVPGTVATGFYSVFGPTQDFNNLTQIQASAAGKRAKNVIAGADAPGTIPTGTLAAGVSSTIAYSFAVNNYKSASDGGAVQTSASGATLPSYAQLYFGALASNGNPLFGWLRKGKIVPRTLTDAEVITLSTLT
jgi:hypothetical protein